MLALALWLSYYLPLMSTGSVKSLPTTESMIEVVLSRVFSGITIRITDDYKHNLEKRDGIQNSPGYRHHDMVNVTIVDVGAWRCLQGV